MAVSNAKFLKLLQDYDKHCLRIGQATSVNIHESQAQKAFRKERLEGDYVLWFEYYFPNFAKKKCAWFHKELANLLIDNKRIRLLAEMYRSAGKSVHIDMGIPLFLYLAKNDLRFMLLIGQTAPKAAQLLSAIQAQLQHNNRIINDYGVKFQSGSWSDGDFTTVDGVRFMSLGFEQNPRGAREQADRPDYIAVDDIDDKRHVNNDKLMREAVDKITEDIWGCFDADDDAVERFVYANNNFHKNSITNRLKQYFNSVINPQVDESDFDEDDEDLEDEDESDDTLFKVLTVCAVKDLQTFEPEWPDKTSAKYWRLKYKKTPRRSFMREYMHVHIEDGAIFNYEDMLYTKVLPLDEYDSLCFYGDLSYKAQGDYKSMFLVGKIGNDFHIIMGYCRQKSRMDIAKWLYNIYEKYGLKAFNIKYLIEGLFAMDEFTNDFNTVGLKRGFFIPVKADKSRKGDKFDRVEALSGFFETHNVYFNEEMKTNADFITLVDQFLAFEKGSGAHDDGPDSIEGAVTTLNVRTRKKNTRHRSGKRKSMRF